MNDTKIYVKGRLGFKPAVKAKLGDAWKQSEKDVNTETIMLLEIPEARLEGLKMAIGEDLISTYELQFLTSLDEHDALELSKGKRSEGPMKMSIWTDRHLNIRARETQLPQRDPDVPVF